MTKMTVPTGLKKLWIAGVAALSLLAPAAVSAQEAAPNIGTYAEAGSGPALWVIRDENSTIYLFGTFHALKPDTPWRTATMDAAFASADEYWFEVANVSDASEALPIIQQKGLSLSRPLSSLLTEEEVASLDRAAQSVNLTAAQLDPMRPWFASMTLAVATITAAGYKPENGGDQILHAMAAATGKPIKGFETMGQQLNFLADMPEDSQLQMLRSSLADFARGPELVHQMAKAWADGDEKVINELAIETSRTEAPAMYEIIYTARNKNWANAVEQMLHGSGTAFIAVGVGHLVGPDSLQMQLEQRGIRAERIELN